MINFSTSFRLTDKDRMEIPEGGLPTALFGIFLFCIGILLVLIAGQIIPMQSSSTEPVPGWGYVFIALMGITFICVGWNIFMGRTVLTIDRRSGRISRRGKTSMEPRVIEWPLSRARQVSIRFTRGDIDSQDTFPVYVVGQSANDLFLVFQSISYTKSFHFSLTLADFLSLPLEDGTTEHAMAYEVLPGGKGVKRQSPFLDDLPAAPETMRCQVQRQGETVRIIVPGADLKWRLMNPTLVLGGIAFFILLPSFSVFFIQTKTPPMVSIVALTFLMFLCLGIPLINVVKVLLKGGRNETILTITPQDIFIDQAQGTGRCLQKFPRGDLFAVDYSTAASSVDGALHHARQRMMDDAKRQGIPSQAVSSLNKSFQKIEHAARALEPFVRFKGIVLKTREDLFFLTGDISDEEIYFLWAILTKELLA